MYGQLCADVRLRKLPIIGHYRLTACGGGADVFVQTAGRECAIERSVHCLSVVGGGWLVGAGILQRVLQMRRRSVHCGRIECCGSAIDFSLQPPTPPLQPLQQ